MYTVYSITKHIKRNELLNRILRSLYVSAQSKKECFAATLSFCATPPALPPQPTLPSPTVVVFSR